MVSELELARDQYIEARNVSGSYWRTVSGGLMAGAGRLVGREVLTPDEKLALARGEYQRLRDDYITVSLEDQEPGLKLASEITDLLIAEAEVLSGREKELSQNTSKLDQLAMLYRNPRFRTALSLGVNIGIAGSLAIGAVPVTAVLVAARVAMGTAGMEKLMKRGQDKISETVGVRSDLFVDTLGVRAKYCGKTEFELVAENVAAGGKGNDLYRELLRQSLQERLVEEHPETHAESLRRVLSNVDDLNAKRDRVLVSGRRAEAIRWAFSGTLVAGFSLLGGGLINEFLQTPVAEATELSQASADTFSYSGIDPLYANDPYLQGNASSILGTAHNIYAERIFGVELPPVDLETNSHEIAHTNYWRWFYQNYDVNLAEVETISRAITEETMSQVEDPMALFAYGDRGNFDIVWHFIHSSGQHTSTGNLGELIRYYLPKIGKSLNPIDFSGAKST